jgi:hypothetical protein
MNVLMTRRFVLGHPLRVGRAGSGVGEVDDRDGPETVADRRLKRVDFCAQLMMIQVPLRYIGGCVRESIEARRESINASVATNL